MSSHALMLLLAILASGPSPAGSGRAGSWATGETGLSSLIATAAAPVHSPARGAARDTLYREVYPRLMAEGTLASPVEMAAMQPVAASLACTTGVARITRAVVMGELAYVAAGGSGGGCSWLLRREGDAWVPLMPLGWTVRG